MKDEKNGITNKAERQWDKLKDNARQTGNKISEKTNEGVHRTQEQFKDWRNDADTEATKMRNRVQEKEQQVDNRMDESYHRAKDSLDRKMKNK